MIGALNEARSALYRDRPQPKPQPAFMSQRCAAMQARALLALRVFGIARDSVLVHHMPR
jgi:hypothetical protein